MLFVKPASEKEAALIADISRETFVDTFADQNTEANMQKFLAEQFSRDMVMAEPGKPNHFFYLAIQDTEPAGYLFLKDEPALDSIEISRIYVRKPFIGKGAGRLLMETAISFAKTRNKTSLWLGVWEQNHRAIRFYESFGFKKFSEHDFILGDDLQCDWLMKLIL